MQKRFIKLSVLLLGILILGTSFSFRKKNESVARSVRTLTKTYQTVLSKEDTELIKQKAFGIFAKSYYGFCKDIGFQESNNNYKAINRLGYLGKYQFGRSTLRWIGVRSKRKFLNSPLLQEKAFEALISKNKYLLRDYINEYNGKFVGGVRISESSLIAAAHLGGAGNVKKFLDSNGIIVFKDANNVPITRYMKQFSNYNLSRIPADRNASARL